MLIQKYNYDPINRETVNGKRHYCLPDGSKVPSVTTILDKTKSKESRDALDKWRKAVGEERAKQITTEAANRGTRMHTYLEHYVKTGEMKALPDNPFAQPSWYMAAQVILEGFTNVNEMWGVLTGQAPRIGFEGESVTPQLAEFFGVKEGVLVRTVTEKTPASKAGLKAGDVIFKINGTPVSNTREISGMVGASRKNVTFTVMRNHKEVTLNVEVAEDRRPSPEREVL